jgi:hypothetical protein
MPKTTTLVKHFFRILLTFFQEKYQLCKFIGFLVFIIFGNDHFPFPLLSLSLPNALFKV